MPNLEYHALSEQCKTPVMVLPSALLRIEDASMYYYLLAANTDDDNPFLDEYLLKKNLGPFANAIALWFDEARERLSENEGLVDDGENEIDFIYLPKTERSRLYPAITVNNVTWRIDDQGDDFHVKISTAGGNLLLNESFCKADMKPLSGIFSFWFQEQTEGKQ